MSQTNTIPAENAHFISLNLAIKMTGTYRDEKENILAAAYQKQHILPLSETFNLAAFQNLMRTQGAAAIRLYYSMDENLKVHAIFVAVNAENEDILPGDASTVNPEANTVILEAGQRCPTICPPASPLN